MLKQVTQQRFDDMLGAVPPAVQTASGFLVGEPITDRLCTVTQQRRPVFAAFFQYGSRYFKNESPMTVAEFKRFPLAAMIFEYPVFDFRDGELLTEREAAWNGRNGPRVGDYVTMPDGELRRFTYDWSRMPNGGMQTTYEGEIGSFYLSKTGHADYSGSLESAIPHGRLVDTGELRPGAFWFFHHDDAKAHNGVHVRIACRVYRVVTAG